MLSSWQLGCKRAGVATTDLYVQQGSSTTGRTTRRWARANHPRRSQWTFIQWASGIGAGSDSISSSSARSAGGMRRTVRAGAGHWDGPPLRWHHRITMGSYLISSVQNYLPIWYASILFSMNKSFGMIWDDLSKMTYLSKITYLSKMNVCPKWHIRSKWPFCPKWPFSPKWPVHPKWPARTK